MLHLLCAGLARLSSEQGDRTLAAGRAARKHHPPVRKHTEDSDHCDAQVSVYCSWNTTDAEDHVLDTPSCILTEGELDYGATVVSVYNRSTNETTGFATLDIVALEHTDPRLSAFAAGYAEGHQTAGEIALFYQNVYEFGDQGPSEALTNWVTDNDVWTRQQAAQHAETDDYWMSVATVLSRFDGMLAGYENNRMASYQPERESRKPDASKKASSRPNTRQGTPTDPVARLPSLSKLDLLWINLDGDLFDLQIAVGELAITSNACKPRPSRTGKGKDKPPHCAESSRGVRPIGRNGRARRGFARAEVENSTTGPMLRCSALVKHRADKRELYFGHSTWDTYGTAAPRIYKHLTLPRQLNEVPRRARWNPPPSPASLSRLLRPVSPPPRQATALRTISMSSSPGFLSSIDDWFLIGEPNLTTSDSHFASTKLSVIETSLEMKDMNAYKAIKSASVLCWIRTMVANQLATDAPSWAHTFGQQASGTYNNQWMVLDVNKAQAATMTAGELPDDSFWVIEEVPGLVHAEDQSGHLNKYGFWSSFNEVYYSDTASIAGDTHDYYEQLRFKIFDELQAAVNSSGDFARLIAWNDYKHDSISQSPLEAVMARGDLETNPSWMVAGGGIDAKYSTVSMAAANLGSHARAGPTDDDQPSFCWSRAFESTPHAGHPRCFEYEWGKFAPLDVAALLQQSPSHRGTNTLER